MYTNQRRIYLACKKQLLHLHSSPETPLDGVSAVGLLQHPRTKRSRAGVNLFRWKMSKDKSEDMVVMGISM